MSVAAATSLIGLQMRVIASLILREARATFGASAFGYIWAVITPTASVGLLVFLFSLIGRQPPFGASLALFFATGILVLQFFNELSGKLTTVFDANRALLTYPLIKPLDTLIARALLIALTYALILAVFFAGLIALGLAGLPARPEQLILAFLATLLFGAGLGAVNAVIFSHWDSWAQIEKILTRPLFFVSGIFYVPAQLPVEARALLGWNPVLHLVEWARAGYYPNYHTTVLQPSYPLAFGVGLLLLGLGAERLFRRARS